MVDLMDAQIDHCNAKLSILNEVVASIGFAHVPSALHPPVLNRHLTKSRLNDAPRLCDMLVGISGSTRNVACSRRGGKVSVV
jgi:hypothetical protein